MATTDSTLRVEVVTTADMTGVNQVRDQMSEVTGRVNGFNSAVKSGTQEAAAGFEMSRREAAMLSRELAAGEISARGLGMALASLGAPVAIAGIAVFTFFKILTDAEAAAKKLNDEFLKGQDAVAKTATELEKMATAAKSQSDLAAVAKAMSTEMDTAQAKVRDLVREAADVSNFQRNLTSIGGAIKDIITLQDQWHTDYATGADVRLRLAQEEVDRLTLIQMHQMQVAEATKAEAAAIPPTAASIQDLNRKYDDLVIQAIAAAKANDVELWKKLQPEIAKVAALIAIVTGEYNKLEEAAKKFREEQDKIAKEAERAAQTEQQKELNAALKEGSLVLQQIHQQQTLIKDNPFMGADEKQVALIQSYRKELDDIAAQYQKLQAMKGGITDPAELERITAETTKLDNQWKDLTEKLSGALHPLQAQLQSWVNSWGTATQQIGKMIEDTIGRSLQELNTWITTGKFNLQSFMQQIEQLGLQLLEHLLLQQIMARINASANVVLAEATGAGITAALAPAAATSIIATEGESAIAAPGQYSTAVTLIEGLAAGLGVAHAGGEMQRWHNGRLAADEVPIIAQAGEIMIQRDVAQRNKDFLLRLNAGQAHIGGMIKSFARGGDVDVEIGSTGPGGVPGPGPGGLIDLGGGTFFDPGSGGLIGGDIGAVGGGGGGDTTATDTGGSDFGISVSGSGTSGNLPAAQGGYGSGFDLGALGIEMLGTSGGGSLGSSQGTQKVQHRGGELTRFHSGGRIGGPAAGGGGVHIYAFTDMLALLKHMGSRSGQKIIFDTVKGQKIDLGL